MSLVIACCCCLETDGNLFSITLNQLAPILEEFIGIPFSGGDNVLSHICVVCSNRIRKFRIFKQNCVRASYQLQQLRARNQLTLQNIKILNKKDYGSNFMRTEPLILSYIPPIKVFHTTTYHLDIAPETIENKLSDEPQHKEMQDYFDSIFEDIETKNIVSHDDKKYQPDDSDNNIYEFNHDDLINNDHDHDASDRDTGIEEHYEINRYDSDIEINEKRVEASSQTEVKKCKLSENNSITENSVPHEDKCKNNKKNTRKKKVLLKNEKKEGVKCKKNKNVQNKRPSFKNKRKEEDAELTELVDQDDQSEQFRKYATLFYNPHPEKQISKVQMQKRINALASFSKAYNVEVRFLTDEEQLVELEQRKKYYKHLPYTCALCCRGFSAHDTYTTHMEAHSPSSGDYECQVCKIRCKTAQDRSKHVNSTHLKRFTCRLCGVVTKSQSYARAHFARHQGASYACDQCDKKFTSATECLSHARATHGSSGKLCPLCCDSFIGLAGLKVHMGIVHKQAVRCGSCVSQFDTQRALDKHLDPAQDIACGTTLRSCPKCGLNFESEKLMKKHYGELHKKEYKCNKCDETFPTHYLLSTHVKERHRGERDSRGDERFVCESCGNTYKNKNQLRYHQSVHTGERPYKCSLCTKTFRTNSLLKTHMKTHTGERRYKCPACPKAFRQIAHRVSHMLTHTKERPHACAACPKRYSGSGSLKEHVDTVHRGLPARKRDKRKDTCKTIHK